MIAVRNGHQLRFEQIGLVSHTYFVAHAIETSIYAGTLPSGLADTKLFIEIILLEK